MTYMTVYISHILSYTVLYPSYIPILLSKTVSIPVYHYPKLKIIKSRFGWRGRGSLGPGEKTRFNNLKCDHCKDLNGRFGIPFRPVRCWYTSTLRETIV